MLSRLVFTVRYFIFWVCLFIIAKIAFLFYQNHQSFQLSADTWLKILWHGLRMDVSMAGYLTLFPAITLVPGVFSGSKALRRIINIYTCLVIIVFLVITLVDFEIYKYWGSRLDSAPLRFLGKPGETLASSSILTIIIYILALLSLIFLLFFLYKGTVSFLLNGSDAPGIRGLPVFLLVPAILIIPIRGGFSVSPINTGTVYFSKVAFANHAAVNVVWNFGQSLVEGKESTNPYIFNKRENYADDLLKLYENQGEGQPVLRSARPNILLIIMESFSAKLIEPLGGASGVTPWFNRLSDEGILFSNIYSTDSRTDKGVATIVSGYPVLEAIPVMRYAEKTQNLPFLTKSLAQYGYHSSVLYGGDVDFANMRSYFMNGGIGTITSENDFPSSSRTGKWGVQDHIVFDRLFNDIQADTGRWLRIMLTLTNHEPFDIPGKPKFGDKTLTTKFYSSAYYADSCIGDFITRLRQTPLWDSTLVILIADHGTRLPQFDDIFEPRKHHIPMLWTGGAVKTDSVVVKTGSQADLAVTLLNQMNIKPEGYVLGKDLLNPDSHSFAFYSIKNGIAMVTDSSGFGYDFISNSLSFSYGKLDSGHIRIARIFQQYVFDNYLQLDR